VENNALSGGAEKFLSFLKTELIPYIDKTYPTNGTNSLYGHSYGGLFSMYAFLAEPELFECCFATDPSFWWNNDYVIKLASERLESMKAEQHQRRTDHKYPDKNVNNYNIITIKMYICIEKHKYI